MQYPLQNGPDKGRLRAPSFRPKGDSLEEVERARLAAVEALRLFEEEDRAGTLRVCGRRSPERQSGVRHIYWDKGQHSWSVQYPMQNGQDRGRMRRSSFRSKDESLEEVERARLAAVEALRRLEEEDRERARLAAVDHSAFDLLAKQLVEVQFMVISKFCPPEEGLSDYSTLLVLVVQRITNAARRPRHFATFSTGCFWESQRLYDAVSGVLNTTVGYTGGNTTKTPAYESVQLGDGLSEAIRIEFDPELITYDALLTHFDRVRDQTGVPVGLGSCEVVAVSRYRWAD